MQDRYIYPAVFEPCEEGGYCVTFPDLPGIVTQGDIMEEALDMAKEALELHLYGLEEDNDLIPEASNPGEIEAPSGGFISMIEATMPMFRDKMANKSITATVTLPRWLKVLADRNHINLSHVLQSGLKDELGVYSLRMLKGNAGTGQKILENWDKFKFDLSENDYKDNKTYIFEVKYGEQKGHMTIKLKNGVIAQETLINLNGFSRPLGAYNDTSGFKDGLYEVARRMLVSQKLPPFDK